MSLVPRPYRDRLIAAASPKSPYGDRQRVQAIDQVVDELRAAHPKLFLSPKDERLLAIRFAAARDARKAMADAMQGAA